jgi:exodeoxyribonuclease VII small subunit
MTTMTRTNNAADSLEEQLRRLDAIAQALENPATGLSEAITLCEEGVVISEEIDNVLARCDKRVQALIERLRPESGITSRTR